MNWSAEKHKESKNKSLVSIIIGSMDFLALMIIIIIAAGILLWNSLPTTKKTIEALETVLEEEMNMDEKHESIMYQLNYDEEKEKWLFVDTSVDKMMKDAFPDSDAESEKYRAEEPKTYQSDW